MSNDPLDKSIPEPINDDPATPPARVPLAEELPADERPAQKSGAAPAARVSGQQVAPARLTAQGESALRTANLLRVRGDVSGAVSALKAALATDPASGSVHEMLGDLYAQMKDPARALDSYRRAQSCGAGASIDAKIGRLLVQDKAATTGLAEPALVRGRGAVSIVASALIPGLGIALAGDMRSAAVAFGGWLLTLCLIVVLPPTHALLTSFGGRLAAAPSPAVVVLFLALGLANLGFYVYSLVVTVRVSKPGDNEGSED